MEKQLVSNVFSFRWIDVDVEWTCAFGRSPRVECQKL